MRLFRYAEELTKTKRNFMIGGNGQDCKASDIPSLIHRNLVQICHAAYPQLLLTFYMPFLN